jgi:hypothetical protein
MLLMVLCAVTAEYAQEGGQESARTAYLLLATGWGALGALSVPALRGMDSAATRRDDQPVDVGSKR